MDRDGERGSPFVRIMVTWYYVRMKKIVLIALVVLATGLVGVSCKGSSTEISTPSVDLLTAIDKENISVIKQHIDAGTNINDYPIPKGLPFGGAEPLTLAVLKGNAEIVQLLLDNGADIEIQAKNKDGARPLHWAAFFHQQEMVSFLIESGANVNSIDSNGGTPLDTATYSKLTVLKDAQKLENIMSIIELLIKNGGKSASDL
tara:strand:+ start:148 stop:756 length:609 start_codon:yes stop_codon:yes gene_type:complete